MSAKKRSATSVPSRVAEATTTVANGASRRSSLCRLSRRERGGLRLGSKSYLEKVALEQWRLCRNFENDPRRSAQPEGISQPDAGHGWSGTHFRPTGGRRRIRLGAESLNIRVSTGRQRGDIWTREATGFDPEPI